MTVDQWVAQVQGRVRQADESIRAYCYSKVRICRRCPVPINDREIIRYLTLGINNAQVESVVLAAKPRTLDEFFTTVREWEEFDLDKGREIRHPSGSAPVDIPKPASPGEQRQGSPLQIQIATLQDRVNMLQSKWESVGD